MARKKPKNQSARAPLTGLELEVMDIVWELGDCTSAQVTTAFQKRRALAPTTVRTVLTKLRTKDYLEAIPALERGFKFRPVVPRSSVARRSLKDLLPTLFQNSPLQAISYLIEDADVNEDELEDIRRMLEARKNRKPGGKKK